MRGTLYISSANIPFEEDSLGELVSRAAIHNAEHNITGYLFYAEGKFVQYIEGDNDAVDQLMARIQQDKRHKVLNVFHDDHVVKRRFPSWHMQWIQQAYFIGVEKLLLDYLLLLKDWDQQSYQQENILRLLDTLSDNQEILVHRNAD